MRVSPFGMDECCICDAPARFAIPTELDELLPYCAQHANELKAEFPDAHLFRWPAPAIRILPTTRELVGLDPERELGAGERVVLGRRYYSAAWL